MKAKNRVESAIKHQAADRVPRGEIFIGDAVIKAILGCQEVMFDQRWEFVRRLDLDLICLSPDFDAVSPGNRLPLPDNVEWPNLKEWMQQTDRFIFIMLDGAFGWGLKLLGFEKFFSMLARESADIIDFFQIVEGFNIELAERAVARGSMGVIIADDIAYRRGLMVHPAFLRKYYFPSLARQVAAIEAPVFFHSDGDLNLVLDDICMAGFSGLQCIESAAGMDIGAIKKRYGQRLCLWGNLDPEEILQPRSRRQIKDKVDFIVNAASYEGGFIFGTSSGLFEGVRTENLLMIYGEEGCL